MPISFPKTLPTHPCIAIVAPSGAALDETNLDAGLQSLENAGFKVINYYQHANRFERFGATDQQRLAQLHAAIDNDEVDIVMGIRGSYGLSRILPDIDLQKIANSGKWLVGYSDFNALQLAMLAKTGTASLCGPMLCNDFTREVLSPFTQDQFLSALRERKTQLEFESDHSFAHDLELEGTLWGGNLAMICHLLGTEYFPQIEGGILFVEDIAEHPYRVERMLLQLHMAGILKKQKAIVLGNFSAYRLAPQDNGYDFAAMLKFLRSTIATPVITGLPFGHCDDKASLMQGSHARLRVSGTQVSLSAEY
ncbi:LD-carboxypeptidase [Undibacterium fentianense]|uniref:LD-carboxypeptidase n=1 Tax=Undibacterium fentianense TaxID=2828728 RepID=A0A941E079_9BURK|nr:LD-carboxypeptidase [Undibacterium fentianense]MBR7798612.1 LD-carboxypeptidase [Undibacterium fentianense]